METSIIASVTHPPCFCQRKARVACRGPAGGSIEVDDAAAVGDSVDRAQLIATALNRDRIPTAHGGVCWHPSMVRAVLQQPCPQIFNRNPFWQQAEVIGGRA